MIDDMQVYIANLGKYNEGELVGDWFSFPLDEEVIAERIGLNAEYEEYAIHDTDNFPMEISEYTSIEELNRIYEQLEELPITCWTTWTVSYPIMEVWKNWWSIKTTSFCIPAVKR